MKQLILTGTDSIQSAHEAEHLGPWSLSDAQFFQWGWEKRGIGRAVRHEDILPVSRSLERVCEFYIARLSCRQNERHRRSYSNRYWRMLLVSWLLRLVMSSFERFLRIRKRIQGGTPYLVYLAPRLESFPSLATSHFNALMLADPLNRLIFSRFLRAYQPEGWIMRDGPPAARDGFSLGGVPRNGSAPDHLAKFRKVQRKLEMYQWANILASNLGCVQFQRVYGLNPLDSVSIALRMLFRNRRRWRSAAKSFHPESGGEKENISKDDAMGEIRSIQGIDAKEAGIFLEVVDGLVEETMPKSFTDNFRENEKKALRRVKATAPWTDTVVCGGPVFGDDDREKFYIASLLERRPIKLAINQHGGNYGLSEATPWQSLVEYETADRFISWGWKRQSDYPVTAVPASSPLLSKMKKSRKRNSSIVLVAPGLPAYSGLLHTEHFPEDVAQHMADKANFVRHLNDAPRSVLLYRPHITSASRRNAALYMERSLGVEILQGKLVAPLSGRLSPALSQCGVCVLQYPGTTAAFTMAAGIPTVLFWDKDVWRFSRQGRAALEKLSAANVYHASPESAARHLNAVWPDVDAWWEDDATQAAVGEFANRYYRSSKNWRSEWADLLSSADSELWRDGSGAR